MRAVRLTMKGFGPYVEEQLIDFQRLKDAGLFLITGPTGSGKTTQLDAICFGLYGDSSGGGREGKQMRSDFLQPSQVTEVTFDFKMGSESYRVRRTPAQIRPRRRGAGTTEEPATATLWRRTGVTDVNDDGEVIASQPSAVTEKVVELLGFESSQFRQVALLPQGEFRKFLSATSREREQILEVLFRTEEFRLVEDELKSKAKELTEEVEAARGRLNNFLEAANAGSEDELRQRRDQAHEQVQSINSELAEATQIETSRQEACEAARVTIAKLSEVDAAKTALTVLQAREQEIEATRQKVDAAKKSEQLLQLERSVQERVREYADAQANTSAMSQERAKSEQQEAVARGQLAIEEARQEIRTSASQSLQQLTSLRDRVQKIAVARTELNSAESQYRIANAEVSDLERALRDLNPRIEQRDQQITAFQSLAQSLDFLSLNEQRLNDLLRNRRRFDDINKQLTSSRRQLQLRGAAFSQKVDDLRGLRQQLEALQSDWVTGQAAVLAATLAAGSPCPVCGSTEHPIPTTSDTQLPAEQDLKRLQGQIATLETQIESLRTQVATAQSDVTRLETEAEGLIAQLGDARDTEASAIATEFEDTRRRLEEARNAANGLTAMLEDQAGDRAALSHKSAELEQARARSQESSIHLATARQALAERQDGVPEDIQSPDLLEIQIEQAAARLDSVVKTYEAARTNLEEERRTTARCIALHETAIAAEQSAESRLRAAESEFSTRIKEAGFASTEEFVTAKAAIPRLAVIEAEVQRFDADLLAAQARLGRARGLAADLEPPNMKELEDLLTAAKAKVSSLIGDQHRLSEIVSSSDRLLDQLKKCRENIERLEAAHGVYGRIAEVACGDNPLRITFQRFVQGALFEDVLQAASARLRSMTKGRFELQRAIRSADLRQSGGLDIEVLDSHTGTTRSVSTLSGGEGFMASLSLALGLADIVQNHAGGVRLDSLFIDEGFGSLDAEALDQALQVLTDLRQTGRSIGIISHVSELKERITTRIEVIPQARGSIARIVGGLP